MLLRFVLMIGLCAVLAVPQARAQMVLNEDFQDGDADGWAGDPGRGSIGLTEFAGNISMRMTRNASAFRPVDVAGIRRVKVSADFAAADLEGADACVLEFSENGTDWLQIGIVEDGQDDSVTLHRVGATVSIKGESSPGYVGLRIKGNAANDTCWADNIRIVGVPAQDALKQEISKDVFEKGVVDDVPFAASAFAPPQSGAATARAIEGILRFEGEEADHFRLLKDDFNYAPVGKSLRRLPPVEIEFVQVGDEIVPKKRGPRRGSHRDWEWVVEPGRVWRDEDGALRASFPFALQERNANCIHNGLAGFRFGADGTVSNLVYQIASETCAYMQFDLWGAGAASFERRDIRKADDIVAAYRAEKAARMKTAPIETLADIANGAFGSPEEVDPDAMTAFGYVQDGVHYVSECQTRYGAYPYCELLDLPSYSWAKSIVAGIAAMRMEKLYPGAMAELVADYVPACASDQWRGVTFEQALDMTTGVYGSDIYDVDEASETTRGFFLASTHSEKIDIACNAFRRNAPPGDKFVYRTVDTYILGTAMNAYLHSRTGDDAADLYSDLLVPIWRSIGTSPLLYETRRSYDKTAQPFTGWGLTLHRGDLALITRFLQNGGIVDGAPLLDEAMLAAALQQRAGDRGLPAVIETQRYQNGFWAWNGARALGCPGEVWIPVMSGFGGLSASLLPNGSVYYYVSDGGDFAWRNAAKKSNAIKPFCEALDDE